VRKFIPLPGPRLRTGPKARACRALQTLRESGTKRDVAKRLECGVFRRFSARRNETRMNSLPRNTGTFNSLGIPPFGPGTAGQANFYRGLVGVGPGTCPGTKAGQAGRSRPQGSALRGRGRPNSYKEAAFEQERTEITGFLGMLIRADRTLIRCWVGQPAHLGGLSIRLRSDASARQVGATSQELHWFRVVTLQVIVGQGVVKYLL
jgi:hypothetical protein